jgi:hypothetical protein
MSIFIVICATKKEEMGGDRSSGFLLAFPRRASVTLVAYEPPLGFTAIKSVRPSSLQVASTLLATPNDLTATRIFGHGWPIIDTPLLHELISVHDTPLPSTSSMVTAIDNGVLSGAPLGLPSASRTIAPTPKLVALLEANNTRAISTSMATPSLSSSSSTMAGSPLETKSKHATAVVGVSDDAKEMKSEDNENMIIAPNNSDVNQLPVSPLPPFDWDTATTTWNGVQRLDQSIVDQIVQFLEPLPLTNARSSPSLQRVTELFLAAFLLSMHCRAHSFLSCLFMLI